MPKKGNNSLKKKARQLSRCECIPYSEALARLTGANQSSDRAPVSRKRFVGEVAMARSRANAVLAEMAAPSVKLNRMLAE
ncbi:hypothetical protein, partial [Streptomyces sp. NPDC050264]|uniref:hypothetical protein n=1 Tax=Streptomyces sp. NPDC050264 TaxID=3155038 RepID=UPI00341F7A0C